LTGAVLTGANAAPLGRYKTSLEEPMNEEIKRDEGKDKEILERARRTLGFGPIKNEDIRRQFKDSGRFGIAQN
jgi:hypothetical protein